MQLHVKVMHTKLARYRLNPSKYSTSKSLSPKVKIILDCDVEAACVGLACADGRMEQAVRIYFEQQEYQQIATDNQNEVLS